MKANTRYTSMISMVGVFFLLELVVGIISGSLALQADAFHMLSDLLALIIGYVSIRLAKKEKNSKYTYGWLRAEILGGLINSVFLLALCFMIFLEVVEKGIDIAREGLTNPILESEIDLVLIVAGAGLLVNLIGLVLFGHHHDHDHANNYDDNDIEVEEGNTEERDLNQHAVWLHVLGDTLGSVIVIISSLLIKFLDNEWKFILDPIVSLILVAFISISSFKLLKKTGKILLHRCPGDICRDTFITNIKKVDGVTEVHEFHIWSLTQNINIATVHVQIDNSLNNPDSINKVITDVNQILHLNGIHNSSVQIEFGPNCLDFQCERSCRKLQCC
jgi:zinc transporter 1